MKRKIKIFIGIYSLIVIGVIAILYNYYINKNEQIVIEEEYIEEEYIEDEEGYNWEYLEGGTLAYQVAEELSKKNGNWSRIPLSESFLSKYNEKDGRLKEKTFDKIEYQAYRGSSEQIYFRDHSNYFVITEGKKETAYVYIILYDENGFIDEIGFYDIVEVKDEEGNLKDTGGYGIYDYNHYQFFKDLGISEEQSVYVGRTQNFREKYPSFLDLFDIYSPYDYAIYDEAKSNYAERIAYFIVDSPLQCKKREYIVNYKLNEKYYLDDASAKFVKEESYEGDSSERSRKIFYKNSNWDNLKLTDNFRKKYNPEDGICPDIDNLDVRYMPDEKSLAGDKERYVVCYKDKNKNWIPYLKEYIETEDGYLDDVIITKLDYVNMRASEIKKILEKEMKENGEIK